MHFVWKQSHVEAYERAVAANKYCWIDCNATLEAQPHWKEWFTSLRVEDVPNVTANLPVGRNPAARRPGQGQMNGLGQMNGRGRMGPGLTGQHNQGV